MQKSNFDRFVPLKKCAWLLLLAVSFVACKKEEELSAQQQLEGKWIIESSELLGSEIPGDGSYLRFNPCGTLCTGTDYLASDGTIGNFTYVLSENASSIAITDTTADGGAYNGNWDILELTNNNLRIVGSTVFGSLKIEMAKEN
jgi:hypothetical protein